MSEHEAAAAWRARDLAVAAILAVAVATGALYRSAQLHPVIYQYRAGTLQTSDIWFDADIPKMTCLMTDRLASQHRVSSEHPLISFTAYLPARLLRRVTSLPLVPAFRVLVAIASAAWVLTLFWLLRLIGCPAIDAALFTTLGAVSAAGMFWMAVPESFLPGSATMLLPLGVVAAHASRGRFADATLVLASAASLSMTVTNWMSGLAATWWSNPWRRALQISANALMVVSALWLVQLWLFPEAIYFLGSGRALGLMRSVETTTPAEVLAVLLSHSMVMPEITISRDEVWRGLSVQSSPLGSSGALGWLGTILWAVLLAVGARQLAQAPSARPVRLALAATIVGQVILHLAFGKETFLYAIHILPLLIAVAACGVLGRQRRAVLAVAAALVVAAGINNWRQFERATDVVDGIGQEAAASGAVFQLADQCR